MAGDDITPEQIAALNDKLLPYLQLLRRPCDSCDKQLTPADPPWITAHQAHNGATLCE